MTNSVQVRFFARLREEFGVSTLDVSVADAPDLNSLIHWLGNEHPDWQPALKNQLMTAVNQTLIQDNQPLKPGDEVALFPPVTGG